MATYGWKLADNSGNPLTGPNDWTNPDFWVAYPAANPPVTGTVPGAADSAFVIAGTVGVSTPFGSFNKSYPVTVDVTTGQTVTTLGLGGINIDGINLGTGAPSFGAPTVLPTLDINGGSLDVEGSIEATFTGTISVATPIGLETFSGTFNDGGVIDLTANGTLEVGGTVGAGITVDFDNQSDVLKLDGVNHATPGAFAGVIQGFTVGNSIVLSTLPALHTVTETYSPGVLNAGVLSAGTLTVTDSTLGTLATLEIQGTIPSNYTTANFALAKTANSVTITEVPSAPPPSFAWKNAVNGDWATAADWTPAGPPNAANADATIAVAGAYTVTIAAAESFLVDSLTFAPTGAAVLALNGMLTLGGTQAAMNESAGTVKLAGTIAGGTFTLSGGTLSDIGAGVISSAAALDGGLVTIAAAKTLTLSGATTLNNASITGLGTLATTGATSITGTSFLDSGLVWNNSGTVSAGALLYTGYPTGPGKVTIANQLTGAFDLTTDGAAFFVYNNSTLSLSNAGVLSKTGGTGISSISTALTNTGTLTATSGTLELDSGGALGGTIGATGAGTLALNGGTFTVGGATQTITGALALESAVVSIATGKVLTLAGTTTLNNASIAGPGTLATTGTTSISGQSFLDSKLVWNNSGTVTDGALVYTGYPLGAVGTLTIANQSTGVFDLTVDGGAFYVYGSSTLAVNNAGLLSKTAGTGISSVLGVMTNTSTGTITATSGTLELDGGGTLGGTVAETTTGAVTLGTGVFAYTGTISGAGTLTVDSGATIATTTVSNSVASAVVLDGGASVASGKVLTLSGPVTINGAAIAGPGTLATTGATSITGQSYLDGSLVWDNSGTVSAGALLYTGYPSGTGKVTIANQSGGAFDLTADGGAFLVYTINTTLALSNAGVFSKTAGTGISSISTALTDTNTGTLTASSGTLELDSGGTLGGTIGATGAGVLSLNGGVFTLGAATQTITGALALGAAAINITTGKTLTLAGPTTLNAVTIAGPGILATTGATSVVGQSYLDGSLVWNNTGTVSDGALLYAGYSSGIGNVTIANKAGGVFDLTADGGAFALFQNATLALSNAGVLSKTAGTGVSSISVALTNTGTLTASSGTLELDGGGTLGGTIGATGTGTLALNGGTFTLGGPTQTITGALALESGDVSIATGRTLTLSGPVTWSGAEVDGPGRLATTGKTTITGSGADLDNGLTWTNTGTVLAGGVITTGNPSGTGTIAIVNAAGGSFDVTNTGAVFNVAGSSALSLNNAGTLAKTAGAGISTIAAPVTNTGTITSSSGTLDLNGGGNLAGTIGGTGTGVVLLDAGGSFATTGTLAITDAGAANDLRIGNGGTLTDSGLINDSGHVALGNGAGASALAITAAGNFDFTADDGGIFNGTLGTLSNAGNLAKTGGTGTSTVAVGFANTGTVDAASGTLKLSGLVTGTGQMWIEAGDTLEIATGAVAATNTVDFNGLGATLKIDNNAAVAKPIIGLTGGSRIDLGAAPSATAVISGTTLTVTPTGGAALKFVSSTSLAALHATTGTDGGTGTVVTLYNQAVASTHTPEPVAFGNVHVGDTAVQALAIGNTAPVGIYTENLDASLATTATGFTATGSINGIAAGAANNAALTVALKTATAGNITGTGTLTLSTDGTGVDGFATAALTPQTVNVTGAVYAFAAPNLSTTTLNFGAARVGDAAIARSLTLGDGSSVNAFQESLVYSVGPGPSSISFSNGSGTIASGGSVTVGATLATSTAGDFTGSSASIALTSTGIGTSGLADTSLTAQALALNGKVYADAVANFSAGSVNFGVVHVGDTVSRNLALTNGASGALTDNLTGGTDTLGGTYTGPVGFALGAGGLAAGASGTVSLGLNTALSGTVSGNAVFGFTSHDADLADLGLNGGTVSVTGTVDNFATAQVEDTGGVGSFAGSNGNYTLNLGSVAQGGTALVGDLGVLNAATGLADLLSGTFAVTGTSSFTNTGFTPGFSGLGAGQDERNQAITLNTGTSGVLSETIVLTPTGSNANFSGVLTQETITVTGTIVPAGVTYTLTSAPITISGGVGNDTVIVKNAMLNSHDSINGGGGTNTVQLSGPGSFDLGAPAQLANIQTVVAAEGQAGGTGVQTVYMRNAANLTLNVTSGTPVVGNANPEAITIYGAAASDVINLGGGTDTVVLGGVGETVNGGGGTALVSATAALAGALIHGGTGTTTLSITAAGTATLNAADSHLIVKLAGASKLTLSQMSFITADGSTGADTITAMAQGQTLTGGGGADTLVGFSGFGDLFSDTSAHLNTVTIQQFGGSDAIDLTDLSSGTAKALVYKGTTTAGTLTVSDGTHIANIKFGGNYTTANFQLGTDSHSGSLITFH